LNFANKFVEGKNTSKIKITFYIYYTKKGNVFNKSYLMLFSVLIVLYFVLIFILRRILYKNIT
jgi:hypothetical protein